MFYVLSKFLPLLIYPLGLACVLLGLALWSYRRPRWRRLLWVYHWLFFGWRATVLWRCF